MLKRLIERKGLTLLEVLVAIVCASIALTAFIGIVLSSLQMENYAKNLTTATILAEKMIKEIESGEFPEIGDEEGFIPEEENFYYRKHVSETLIERVREVTLEILWDGKRHGTEFVFYVERK